METALELAVIQDELGQARGIAIDIIDFAYLCHQGKRGNKEMFENLLIMIEALNEEKESNS